MLALSIQKFTTLAVSLSFMLQTNKYIYISYIKLYTIIYSMTCQIYVYQTKIFLITLYSTLFLNARGFDILFEICFQYLCFILKKYIIFISFDLLTEPRQQLLTTETSKAYVTEVGTYSCQCSNSLLTSPFVQSLCLGLARPSAPW